MKGVKVAKVAYGGAIHDAVPHPAGLQLADGRVLAEDAVVWLPPFEVGTIIALGLNYADHVKELSKELTVTAKDEPLAFLKGRNALLGHRAQTRRPKGLKHLFSVRRHITGDGRHANLGRREPERKRARVMLDQNTKESLE